MGERPVSLTVDFTRFFETGMLIYYDYVGAVKISKHEGFWKVGGEKT